MKCPFTLKTLDLARAAGWFEPMDKFDYMAFADAMPGSLKWQADPDGEWFILYGKGYGEPEEEPASYEVVWNDTDWEGKGREPMETRCWHVYPDGRVAEL